VVSRLRVHFTADDVARTRVAAGPDVMWEIALSLLKLQNGHGGSVFDGWRRDTVGRLGRSVELLAPLVPLGSYFADFLTPAEGVVGLDQGIEAVLATPRARLRTEVELLAAGRRMPPWARRLADGEVGVLAGIGRALRSYYEAAVAPIWGSVVAAVAADRALRIRAFLDGGCEGVLASLGPTMRWSSPVLEAEYDLDRELHLGGRGLLLVPSFFCWHTTVTLVDPELPPVLVYPVERDWSALSRPANARSSQSALTGLLGSTRARVLAAIEEGCNTTELARRTAVSIASASEHAAVLREAGLVHSQRRGSAVLHTVTPLGGSLLARSDG
jgi:DNA-binding transcriptional ArsR family regulator